MSFQQSGSITYLKPIKGISDIPHRTRGRNPERTFLPSFGRRADASLTIEAAITLPLFLFFVCCMIHFLLLISLQSEIQLHMDEAARQIGKRAYAADESEILSLISSNSFTIRAEVLKDGLKERLDSSRIKGGSSGFHTILSSYDRKTSELDIYATYDYPFPYFPEKIASFKFMQRSISRAWTGKPIGDGDAPKEEESSGRTVYITPNGTAWHSTTACSYLDLSIRAVAADSVSKIRSKNGRIYGKCKCVTDVSPVVYVTDYGLLYHSDTDCFALKRTVLAVDISEVEGRHPCKKCTNEEGGN